MSTTFLTVAYWRGIRWVRGNNKGKRKPKAPILRGAQLDSICVRPFPHSFLLWFSDIKVHSE